MFECNFNFESFARAVAVSARILNCNACNTCTLIMFQRHCVGLYIEGWLFGAGAYVHLIKGLCKRNAQLLPAARCASSAMISRRRSQLSLLSGGIGQEAARRRTAGCLKEAHSRASVVTSLRHKRRTRGRWISVGGERSSPGPCCRGSTRMRTGITVTARVCLCFCLISVVL